MYPTGTNIYRKSKGIKPPVPLKMEYAEVKNLLGLENPDFTRTVVISNMIFAVGYILTTLIYIFMILRYGELTEINPEMQVPPVEILLKPLIVLSFFHGVWQLVQIYFIVNDNAEASQGGFPLDVEDSGEIPDLMESDSAVS